MKKILSGILLCLLASGVLHAGVYEYDYHFSQPRMQQKDGHMIVRLSGCRQTGITGEPQMPAYPLMILLPKGEALDSVEVLKGPGTDYPVMLPVMPKQADRPLSMRTPEKTFLKHQEAYEKSEYAVREMESAVHRFRGANVLTGVIRPLRHFPRSGTLRLTEKMTLRIHTRPDPAGLPEHKAPAMLKTLVQNPGMLSTYPAEGGGAERMLIITSNAFSSAFDVLREHYRKYGIETELVSKEDILLGQISGRDLQERIRNTIREQYREEGLDYVLLGGDSDIVPHRGLSCTVNSGGEIISSRNIPADLYYAALDGSWDDNRNSVFGEYNDTTGYDEADLLPELAVGRMPARTVPSFGT
ncbi:MAG: C25 family cysteine peptidase [Candidatus Marinimicrobia bacterium]|nr:C25 family cysteine peptidase [Candidatus Neomarinimicrobiota bacterium]